MWACKQSKQEINEIDIDYQGTHTVREGVKTVVNSCHFLACNYCIVEYSSNEAKLS